MIPRRRDIIRLIPPPSDKDEFIVEMQGTDDILMCVYDCVRTSEGFIKVAKDNWQPNPKQDDYCKNYAHLFLRGNVTPNPGGKATISVDGVCADIWDFMQEQWPYDPDMAEGEERQTGRTVRDIIYTISPKTFDCKHYSTFAFATLRALGIPCTLRMTSYNVLKPDPSHIYVVAGCGAYNASKEGFDEEFIIDGTMPEYDEETTAGVTQVFKVKVV